jgi:hypothetical protein
MTKFDFGLLLTLVMLVFLILGALHVPFIPMIPGKFVETVQSDAVHSP